MGLPLGRNFYMMRHAQSEDNANKVVSGSGRATNLTEEGRRQAVEVRELLVQIPINRVVTSEMQRSIDTAKLACDHLPCSQDSGLNERAYGAAEGMSDRQRQKLLTVSGGIAGEESKDDLRIRTIEVIAKDLGGRDGIPLFITHGGNIRRVLAEIFGGEDAIKKKGDFAANCGLYEFIAAKIDGEKWEVNILTLGDNKEINRRAFGER